jgi:zinc transporter
MTPATYGSDPTGLICGFCFSADGVGGAVSADQALEFLAAEKLEGQAQGFVWLHFNLSHTATEKWLRDHKLLPDVFREALHEGSRSTRVELDDDMLMAVINDVHFDFNFESSDISSLWLTVNPRCVISLRSQPLRSIDRLRDAVKQGRKIQSSVALLVHLMHDQGDVLVRIVRDTTVRIDTIEDQLLSDRLEKQRADLGALRRLLVRLQRLLAPEPAALFRLLQKPPTWIGEDDLQDLRQATEEFTVVLRDMTELQERIKLLQEEIAGRATEANNRSLYVLTVVTVLALPINIIAGLLGMNVGGIPWAQNDKGFWIVVAIILSFTAVAARLAFKKFRD